MCNTACIISAAINLSRQEIEGKRVLEIGSCDVNGSLRPLILGWTPAEYVGVDIVAGPGVDVICRAEELVEHFSVNSFDVVLSTELLEHIKDWRKAISNMKRACKPGGIIFITTRSIGFRYHGYPNDFWRYEPQDMEEIFSDCEILTLEKDEINNGTFVKISKHDDFDEKNLSDHALYSIITGRRMKGITKRDFIRPGLIPMILKDEFYKYMMGAGQFIVRKFKL